MGKWLERRTEEEDLLALCAYRHAGDPEEEEEEPVEGPVGHVCYYKHTRVGADLWSEFHQGGGDLQCTLDVYLQFFSFCRNRFGALQRAQEEAGHLPFATKHTQ